MLRTFPLLPLLALVSLSLLAACEAHLDNGCTSGPCGPEGVATGSGGAGGAGGSGGAGGGDACAATPTTGAFPCPVYQALKAKCQTCHTSPPANGAPFSLLTFEDTRPMYGGKPRWVRMQSDIESGNMPFGTAPKLTDAEKKTLLDWLGSCAAPVPESQGCECTKPTACP